MLVCGDIIVSTSSGTYTLPSNLPPPVFGIIALVFTSQTILPRIKISI